MFENIVNFFKKLKKTDQSTDSKSIQMFGARAFVRIPVFE